MDQRFTARVRSELSYLRSLESGSAALGEEEARATAVRDSQRRLVELVRAKHSRADEQTPADAVDLPLHTVIKVAALGLLLLANVVFWLIIAPALGVGEGP